MKRFSFVLSLVLGFPLVAAAEEEWVGQQVFWKDGAKAKVGYQEVGIENIPFPAVVEAVEGPWLWLGRAWVKKSDVMLTGQALDYYADLVRREPADAAWWRRRGAVEATQGQWDSAIADYTKAITLEPGSSAALNNRGIAWKAKGNLEKALADFSEAIRIDARRPLYFNSRGTIYHQLGQFDKAVDDYNQALALDSNYAMAWHNAGLARFAQKQYDKAVVDYTRAIELDSRYAPAYENRGVALSRQGETEKAVADFNHAITLEPQSTNVYFNRGLARARLGQYQPALNDYNRAIELDPQSAGARNGRAWLRATCALAKYRDGKQAVADATELCKLTDWKLPGALDTLAVSYAETGDFPAAIKWQQKALELSDELGDKSLAPELRQHLALFQAGKPFHDAGK